MAAANVRFVLNFRAIVSQSDFPNSVHCWMVWLGSLFLDYLHSAHKPQNFHIVDMFLTSKAKLAAKRDGK